MTPNLISLFIGDLWIRSGGVLPSAAFVSTPLRWPTTAAVGVVGWDFWVIFLVEVLVWLVPLGLEPWSPPSWLSPFCCRGVEEALGGLTPGERGCSSLVRLFNVPTLLESSSVSIIRLLIDSLETD